MFEGLEKRVNYFGNISYWKEDEMGNYKTDDGIEEFENILNQHGLEYINGELRRIV